MFAVGDEAPVFHGAGFEIWDGNLVELGERVGSFKEIIVEIERFSGKVGGVYEIFVRLRERGVGGNFYVIFGGCFEFFKLSDNESEEISGHYRCGFESGGAVLLAFDWHIADNGVSWVGGDGEIESGFGGRLINTREALPGVVGFELGGDDGLGLSVVFVG